MRRHSPKSIQDLKEKGFCKGNMNWFAAKEISGTENFLIHNYTYQSLKEFEEDENFFQYSKKNCWLYQRPPKTKRSYIEYNTELHKDPVKFATDNLVTIPMAIRTTKNLYFFKAIRDTLQRLFESGFMDDFQINPLSKIKKTKEFHFFDKYEKKEAYSTLRWDQLYPGFYIWFAALIICKIVFMLEIIVYKLKNRV